MLEPEWTYTNPRRLTKWYGHVDYYGPYVIGQWFALDAQTGAEHWSRTFNRPTTVCGCTHDVIVASETRSDGPWTAGFGIYGISAPTGELFWTNHGRGGWGKLLRCLDFVPGFTNEFRDVPRYIVDGHVITASGRCLDVPTGQPNPAMQLTSPAETERTSPARKLYDDKALEIDGDTISVQGHRGDFMIQRRDRHGQEVWRFAAAERALHVDGNYYSYRIHGGQIFIVLGDAPNVVPIKKSAPFHVKPNPANYQLGILDVTSGDCKLYPLTDALQRTECRIETIRDDRILISCEGRQLAQYRIAR